jgi:hypothetical protein|tara:strand:- start:669 stop:941 length:273 start_codon:yes stop_codon:yes gene_type:complete
MYFNGTRWGSICCNWKQGEVRQLDENTATILQSKFPGWFTVQTSEIAEPTVDRAIKSPAKKAAPKKAAAKKAPTKRKTTAKKTTSTKKAK